VHHRRILELEEGKLGVTLIKAVVKATQRAKEPDVRASRRELL